MWQQTKEFRREGKSVDYRINKDGLLTFKERIFVPNRMELKELILKECHRSNYSRHLGYQKMLTTIRKNYFCPSMIRDIVEYLNKCLECQQVKVEHRHPAGLMPPLPVPEWKWEVTYLDFITGLPRSKKHNDSIVVVVD